MGHRFSNPLPLPLPSREGHSFRNSGSFKASNVSGPLEMSGPLPLPLKKCDGLRIFSYEEISSACQRFSSDQCVSETLGSTSYKATFRDEFIDTRTTEATVARLRPSTQVPVSAIDLQTCVCCIYDIVSYFMDIPFCNFASLIILLRI